MTALFITGMGSQRLGAGIMELLLGMYFLLSDKAEARAVFTELLEKSGETPGAVVTRDSWSPVSLFSQRNSFRISFF